MLVPASKAATDLIDFNETKRSALFYSLFDDLCCHRFLHAIVGFNNHCTSLVDISDFDNFVALASRVIPNLWKHMCNLRNVSGYYHKGGKESVDGKQ